MKPLKLIDYSLVVVSMMYSSYVTFWFVKEYFETTPIALSISIFIVFLSHHYTFQTITFFQANKSINQYAILAVLLTSMIFYAEWNGQLLHVKDQIGLKNTTAIDAQIAQVQDMILENSKHTVKGKTNWAKYQTFLDAQKNLQLLEDRRVVLLEEITVQESEAEQTANSFRAFSVLLFVLAFLASSVQFKGYDMPKVIDQKTQKIIGLIKNGEIKNADLLVNYFNLTKEEALFLMKKHSPSQQIGF
ncbi:hypothetical protein [Flammeovirga aprica]|uniref:DUF4407 domain-containing protein n=1 Tax=Flammeovirga aprica JL-4 TaxID=694437 RepID=A0A7X9RZ84_9BACT|nr:hypothetical protein [Flammeovirga aprica]NME71522.1 hypothetical protein [Flammeovirga aprica JL-4]